MKTRPLLASLARISRTLKINGKYFSLYILVGCFYHVSRMDPKHLLAQEKDAKRFRKVEVQPSNLFQWDAQTGS